jgi:TolA-binding protein
MDTMKCITNDIWELYAAGKSTPDQLHEIEQHALSCEPCADIKEGIDAMADPSTLAQRVSAINSLVDEKVSRGLQRSSWFTYTAAAASLLVTAVLGWFLWTSQQTPVALQHENPAETTIPQTIGPKENSGLVDGIVKEEKAEPQHEDQPPAIADRSIKQPAVADQPLSQENTSDLFVSGDEGPVAPEAETKDAGTAKEQNTDKQILDKKITETSVKPQFKTSKESIPGAGTSNNYNISNNNTGTPTSQVSTITDSTEFSRMINMIARSNDSVNYNKALEYYADREYDSCRITLKQVLKDSNSVYYEDGLFLLTKAQVKQKKNKNAEQNLKKVISLKGKRQKEAEELMRGLK